MLLLQPRAISKSGAIKTTKPRKQQLSMLAQSIVGIAYCLHNIHTRIYNILYIYIIWLCIYIYSILCSYLVISYHSLAHVKLVLHWHIFLGMLNYASLQHPYVQVSIIWSRVQNAQVKCILPGLVLFKSKQLKRGSCLPPKSMIQRQKKNTLSLGWFSCPFFIV